MVACTYLQIGVYFQPVIIAGNGCSIWHGKPIIVLKHASLFPAEYVRFRSTAVGTRPWTNRFTSASTTVVSSSSQSHMGDPDWIHILGKQCLPCVKGKVTVYVTCQCSKKDAFGVAYITNIRLRVV